LRTSKHRSKTAAIEDGFDHATRVQNDRYLQAAYEYVYEQMTAEVGYPQISERVAVEIGSAGGFLKRLVPWLITTDVRVAPEVMAIVDATRLPFADNSVHVFFLKDTLHHIPDVSAFLDDATRCLVQGGRIVCVEPYWGTLARFIYRYIHPEPFDQDTKNWTFTSSGPMASNQALLWMLLRRDRRQFEARHQNLVIYEHGPLLGPSYVFAGGARSFSLLPKRWLVRLLSLERRTTWWRKHFALAYLVVLEVRE
jgi:SAM-dependent methyltransferase